MFELSDVGNGKNYVFLVYDACKTTSVGPTAESNSSKRVSLMNTFNIAESLLVPVMNK